MLFQLRLKLRRTWRFWPMLQLPDHRVAHELLQPLAGRAHCVPGAVCCRCARRALPAIFHSAKIFVKLPRLPTPHMVFLYRVGNLVAALMP